jgi:hypothetical protein
MHGDAAEIPAVSRVLAERGAPPLLLDTARFPTDEPLSLEWGPGGRFAVRRGDGDPIDVAAVWQGVVAGRDLPAMDPGTRRTCVGAAEMALLGMLDAARAFQLDPAWLRARAENKPAQLRAAQEAGLDVPATVVTNDPAAVRALASRCPRLVTKMLIQPISDEGEETVVFTSELDPADLDRLGGLELCPMIFQERIESALDVRVTIAGRVVHAAAVGPGERLGTDVDWRRDSHDQERAAAWAPHDLPRPIADRLIAVLDHFGLEYGAFDLVVAPDGRHLFLELNPAGSFSFLGPAHEAAIAGAIADVLVDRSARRLDRRA